MSFPISDQVSLTISIAAGGFRAPEMATPMLVGYHVAWLTEYVREYRSLTEMVSDGIPAYSPLWRMAQALSAQTPAPRTWKVGRRATAHVHAVDVSPMTFVAGAPITLTITAPNGNSRSYSQTAGGVSLAAEATALALLINNDALGFSTAGTTQIVAAGVADDLEIRAGAGAVAGQIFYYSGMRNCFAEDVTADPGLAADLVLIRAEDDDWYGGALDSPSLAEQTIFASSLDVAGKTAWLTSQDGTIRAGTAANLGLVLQAASRQRAVLCYTPHGCHEYPGAAAMGKMLAFGKPGATTLANQTLAGVTAAGTNAWDLSTAQLATLRSQRCNAYIDFAGVPQVDPQAGYCSSARYVDERLTLDYLVLNIPTELANAIAKRVSGGSKIPYLDEAAAVARAAILTVCESAERWGALLLRDGETDYFNFSFTPAASQLAADKAARIFRGCEFSCLITGAAQQFVLNGTLEFV